jgi:hypothetical protein
MLWLMVYEIIKTLNFVSNLKSLNYLSKVIFFSHYKGR